MSILIALMHFFTIPTTKKSHAVICKSPISFNMSNVETETFYNFMTNMNSILNFMAAKDVSKMLGWRQRKF